MQNGAKTEDGKTSAPAFSDAETPPNENAEERCEDASPQQDYTAAVLERHERLVNKIKSRK
ncbi:MAG: hypothetical protein ACI4QN_03625 [Candidatus Coproplasma sp.]